jgi:phenylpropionate dioxygenase-like ring-hydroxylating dioxygenase large terminal subunit
LRLDDANLTDMQAADPIAAAWHPAGWARDIGAGPHPVRLLGRELVVFRDGSGAAVTVPAACPHRGTNLGLGSVVDGQVRCPYHAWSFDSTGRCTRIPSLGADDRIPDGAHTTTYPTVERDGLVWVSLAPSADPATIPAFPTPATTQDRVIVGEPMVWRTSAGRHVENILDLAHFPFVHPATFGCDESETVEPHDVTILPGAIDCEVGVTTRNPDTPDGRLYPALGPLIQLGYHYRVDLPYRTTLEFAFPDGMRRALHEVVAPTGPSECTIYWALLVDARLDSPAEDELAFARQVFAEDQPIIESQPPGVPVDRRREVHVPADKLAVAYRRALREAGVPEGSLV